MSSVVISGDTSGAITLAAPSVAGTNTATLPAATGTVMVSGNMPAFSAYSSSASQSIATSTYTKVTLNAENWDTANCFDSTTNYRFTPTVAGYYQVNGQVNMSSASITNRVLLAVYKNGSIWQRGNNIGFTTGVGPNPIVSTTVYCNGSTDYIELYVFQDSGGSLNINSGDTTTTYFNGCLVRTA